MSASAPANGTAQAANWLPAPTDAPFQFILRTYLPPASSILGHYAPPAIVKVGSTPVSTGWQVELRSSFAASLQQLCF